MAFEAIICLYTSVASFISLFWLYEASTNINTIVNDLAKEVVETVSKHALILFFQTWSCKHACKKTVAVVEGAPWPRCTTRESRRGR